MRAAVVALQAALEEQLAVFTELGTLLQEEQQAIAALDTNRMEQLNRQKEPVVARQFRAVDALRSAMAVLSRQTGGGAAPTLSDLMARLPKDAQMGLAGLQKAVQEAGARVHGLAQENRGMLERFLGTVNDALGYLLRVLNTSNQYGSSGT